MNKNLSKIQKIANEVYKRLGSGFPEDIYDKAMQVDLRLAGIKYESQRTIEVKYKEYHVGTNRIDIIVNFGKEKVILELKAIAEELGEPEKQQLQNYLDSLKIGKGLLINFPQPGKRKAVHKNIKPQIVKVGFK